MEDQEYGTDIRYTQVIPTSSGNLQGFVDEANQVEVFLGIPYAEPPVDDLRFKPTVPINTPDVERLCIEHAPAAPQTQMPFDTLMCVQIDNQSEDCLYLNIWTPDVVQGTNRPVVVWFHPGACMSGSSSQPFWDGTSLARNDVIIVSFNYRLGALGWMPMEHISPEYEGSSNLGLLDQIAALKWVQQNIAAFGGDPNNVTAFGSSAGATCIMSLILSPNTSGLFNKIVLQSPPMFHISPKDWAEFKGDIFTRSLGCTKDNMDDLKQIDIETFLDAQTFMTTWPNFLEGLAPIGPSADKSILPSTLIEHFFHNPLPAGYENLEIVIGYTRDEFNFFFPFLPNFQEMNDTTFVRTYFTHIFGTKYARRAYEIYKEEIVPPMSPPSEVARYMCSDVMSRVATLLTAENMAKRGHKVWLYEWDYESNDVQNIIKAAHMVDSIFSWDNLVYWTDNPFLGPGDDFERDRIAKQVSRAIVQFAKTGDPNHSGIPDWPVYLTEGDVHDRNAMVFDREVRVEKNIYDSGLQLWKTVLKDYVQTPMFPIKPKVKEEESVTKPTVESNGETESKKRKISQE
ncbi:alpha/beta-hydrolase [Backusella circina FSU 941]|nr:alpha/beta-hydrolase [Backusella circina FSU 941]